MSSAQGEKKTVAGGVRWSLMFRYGMRSKYLAVFAAAFRNCQSFSVL